MLAYEHPTRDLSRTDGLRNRHLQPSTADYRASIRAAAGASATDSTAVAPSERRCVAVQGIMNVTYTSLSRRSCMSDQVLAVRSFRLNSYRRPFPVFRRSRMSPARLPSTGVAGAFRGCPTGITCEVPAAGRVFCNAGRPHPSTEMLSSDPGFPNCAFVPWPPPAPTLLTSRKTTRRFPPGR
jgi:hypothetical protein